MGHLRNKAWILIVVRDAYADKNKILTIFAWFYCGQNIQFKFHLFIKKHDRSLHELVRHGNKNYFYYYHYHYLYLTRRLAQVIVQINYSRILDQRFVLI